jgi:hypothetical protein
MGESCVIVADKFKVVRSRSSAMTDPSEAGANAWALDSEKSFDKRGGNSVFKLEAN